MTHGQLTKKLAKYGLYSPIARELKISMQAFHQGVRLLKNERYIAIGRAAVIAIEGGMQAADAAQAAVGMVDGQTEAGRVAS